MSNSPTCAGRPVVRLSVRKSGTSVERRLGTAVRYETEAGTCGGVAYGPGEIPAELIGSSKDAASTPVTPVRLKTGERGSFLLFGKLLQRAEAGLGSGWALRRA